MSEITDMEVAFENAPIGIVLTEKRIIKACNQTFADLLGYQKSELLDQSFLMLYPSRKEFDQIRDIGIHSLKDSGEYSDERMMTRKDGKSVWCRFRAHTLTPDSPLDRSVLSFAVISEHATNIRLTTRERQVISALVEGMTSKEIGRKLEISPRTVEDVRSRLLKKYSAKNTTELLFQLTRLES